MSVSSESFDPLQIKLVVFDLDGTLADTAGLFQEDVRRRPYDILKYSGPSDVATPLHKLPNASKICSDLIQCGVRVAIITNSPRAYASTLCALLGIDFDVLIPANNHDGTNTKVLKLKWMSKRDSLTLGESIAPKNILYVGDRMDDENAAKSAGCHFEYIDRFLKRPTQETRLRSLVRHSGETCAKRNLPDTKTSNEPLASRYSKYRKNQEASFELFYADKSWRFEIDTNLPTVALDLAEVPEILNPFMPQSPLVRPIISPRFVTRYAYETDRQLLAEFFPVLHEHLGSKRIHGSSIHSQLAEIEIHSHLKYSSNRLAQDLWKQIKNWQHYSAGTDVDLLHLEFVALCMAASIHARGELGVIVAMPSSSFSRSKPGRVSDRLAKRIADLLDFPYYELFFKNVDKSVSTHPEGFPFTGKAILIDDQITNGALASKCVELMHELNIQNIEIRTWSASKFFPMNIPRPVRMREVSEQDWFMDALHGIPRVGRKVHDETFGIGVITAVYESYLEIDFRALGTRLLDRDDPKLDYLE